MSSYNSTSGYNDEEALFPQSPRSAETQIIVMGLLVFVILGTFWYAVADRSDRDPVGLPVVAAAELGGPDRNGADRFDTPALTAIAEPTLLPPPVPATSAAESTPMVDPTSIPDPTGIPEPTGVPVPTGIPDPTGIPEPTSIPDSTVTGTPVATVAAESDGSNGDALGDAVADLNELVALEPIQFAKNSAAILPESRPTLDRAIVILSGVGSGARVEVEGHTDSDGEAELNQALSDERATAVLDYLVAGGIEPEILTARGFGETRLKVDPELGSPDKAANRRIEFSVTDS